MPAWARLVAACAGAGLLMPPSLSGWSVPANIGGAVLGAALLALEYTRREAAARTAAGAAE
jgi:hypothetical protein